MHLTKGVALRLLVLLALPAPAASSLHQADLECQEHETCKQTLTVEHGQEPVDESSSGQEELVLLQVEHELLSPRRHFAEKGENLHEGGTRIKNQLSATLGRGALLQAAIVRTRGMDAFTIILFLALIVAIMATCCALVMTNSRKADEFSGYTDPRDRRTMQGAEYGGSAQGLLTSSTPAMGTRRMPSPALGMKYERMSPVREPVFPAAAASQTASLKLPTDLIVNQSGGATFTFASGSGRSQSKSGATRIPITNVSTSQEVASLHLAEDEAGSGILFEISPDIPVAYLENWPSLTGGSRQVALFGASVWDAMAAPEAIVQPMFADFVMMQGNEQLLHIVTNPQGQLTEVRDKNRQVVATFTTGSGPGTTLHINRGVDAGLVLMATTACLDFLGPPGMGTSI